MMSDKASVITSEASTVQTPKKYSPEETANLYRSFNESLERIQKEMVTVAQNYSEVIGKSQELDKCLNSGNAVGAMDLAVKSQH